MNSMNIVGWILLVLAIFLFLDAVLAIILGKRYMLWGLGYMPAAYRALIERISEFPPAILLGLKLAEGIVGFGLFWIARKLMQ